MNAAELLRARNLQDHVSGLFVQDLIDQSVVVWCIENYLHFMLWDQERRGNTRWFCNFHLRFVGRIGSTQVWNRVQLSFHCRTLNRWQTTVHRINAHNSPTSVKIEKEAE